MSKLEHRTLTVTDVRAPEGDGRTFEAVVMNYGVTDDFDTVFDAGCFTASLAARMPRITWGHDWRDVIGRWVDYVDSPEKLRLIGELDDFDAVPRARQASAQLRSGTIDQFSVGFGREEVTTDEDGRIHFTRARLDECALVLAGAVPGTELVSVRAASGLSVVRQVPVEYLDHLAERVEAGDMTKAQAQVAIDIAAGIGGGGSDGTPDGGAGVEEGLVPSGASTPAAADLDFDADAALDAFGL